MAGDYDLTDEEEEIFRNAGEAKVVPLEKKAPAGTRENALEYLKRRGYSAGHARKYKNATFKDLPARSFDDVARTYYGGSPGFQGRYDMLKGASTRAQEAYMDMSDEERRAAGLPPEMNRVGWDDLWRGHEGRKWNRRWELPMTDWSQSSDKIQETKWDMRHPQGRAVADYWQSLPATSNPYNNKPYLPARINYYHTKYDPRGLNKNFLEQPGSGMYHISNRNPIHEWRHHMNTEDRGQPGKYLGYGFDTYNPTERAQLEYLQGDQIKRGLNKSQRDAESDRIEGQLQLTRSPKHRQDLAAQDKRFNWAGRRGEFGAEALIHKMEDMLGEYRPPQYPYGHEFVGFSGRDVKSLGEWKADYDKMLPPPGSPTDPKINWGPYNQAVQAAKQHQTDWEARRAAYNKQAREDPGSYKMSPKDIDRVYDKVMQGLPFSTHTFDKYLKTLSPRDQEKQILRWKKMIELADRQPTQPGMFYPPSEMTA